MNLDPIQRASQAQFARQSQHYGPGHILENVDDLHAALQHLQLPSSARVLDVATGGGHTGLFFAALGHQVTVSDIAEPMLARTAEAAKARQLSLKCSLHSAEDFPYPPASFDLVTCRIAAHHFSSPAAFVRETARVLVPGGSLLLIDGTVEDGQPEAEAWLHEVEKLRDPSHQRLLTPAHWRRLCSENGLEVRHLGITLFKQPDLNWYFDAAATAPANRQKVLDLVAQAPASARRLFKLADENGKTVWWWQRLTLVATRCNQPSQSATA